MFHQYFDVFKPSLTQHFARHADIHAKTSRDAHRERENEGDEKKKKEVGEKEERVSDRESQRQRESETERVEGTRDCKNMCLYLSKYFCLSVCLYLYTLETDTHSSYTEAKCTTPTI